jgi:hypothetical protein
MGLGYFTIAYLTVRVVLGAAGAEADKGGALRTLAAQPGGRALLWCGHGRACHAHVVAARPGRRRPALGTTGRKRTLKRIESVATGVVFGVLAVSSAKLAAGGGAGSSNQQEAVTAGCSRSPSAPRCCRWSPSDWPVSGSPASSTPATTAAEGSRSRTRSEILHGPAITHQDSHAHLGRRITRRPAARP